MNKNKNMNFDHLNGQQNVMISLLLIILCFTGCEFSNEIRIGNSNHQKINRYKVLNLLESKENSHRTAENGMNHLQQSPIKPGNDLRVKTGFTDFKELLLRSDVFVDKSMFIKELLDEENKVTMIARPRKWGKSINLDMVKRFLEIEVDQTGTPVSESEKLNTRLFCGGTVNLGTEGVHSFKPLQIANQASTMKLMGRSPVISISFKSVKGYGFYKIATGVKQELVRLFRRHAYLKAHLSDELKRHYDVYLSGNCTDHELRNSLSFLSDQLYKRFNKNVIVLIDDYDTPIISSHWELNENHRELHMVLKMFRDLFSTTFNCPYVHKGLVTGLLKYSGTRLFKEVNSKVKEYSVHAPKFSQSFGFTESEVDELLSKVNTSTEPSNIKRYYNGYAWGGQNLYNPLSIMSCLQNDGTLDSYWMDSGSSLTININVFRGTMAAELPLLESKGIFMYQTYEEINVLEIFEGFKEMWLSLLVATGYLNVADDVDYQGDEGYRLSFPNQEVRESFVPKILKWVVYNEGDYIISIAM